MGLTLRLSDLTYGLLEDMTLGDVSEINVLLSTQTLAENRLLPGFYLAASSGSDFVGAVLDYAATHFSQVILKIAPPIGDIMDILVDTAKSALDFVGISFAMWFNTNSLGFLVTFPAGIELLGEITLTCKVKLTTFGITCGIGYDFPQWLTAIWDGVKLVGEHLGEAGKWVGNAVGAITSEVTQAIDTAEQAVGEIKQMGKYVDKVGEVAARGLATVESWSHDLADGAVDVLEDFVDGLDVGDVFPFSWPSLPF